MEWMALFEWAVKQNPDMLPLIVGVSIALKMKGKLEDHHKNVEHIAHVIDDIRHRMNEIQVQQARQAIITDELRTQVSGTVSDIQSLTARVALHQGDVIELKKKLDEHLRG